MTHLSFSRRSLKFCSAHKVAAKRLSKVFRYFLAAICMTISPQASAQSIGFGPASEGLVRQALAGDSTFKCSDIIGKVYRDKNQNGYQDQGETGLPGVRLVTMTGLISITDKYGRYHVTCADTPNSFLNSNFVVKLDARSLPSGYEITTENPRAVTLTRGRVKKVNFGVAGNRIVRLDLTEEAFNPKGTSLNPQWNAGVDQLLNVLDKEPSILRLTYHLTSEDQSLADKRMRATSRLVKELWQQRDGGYRLEIEQALENGQ